MDEWLAGADGIDSLFQAALLNILLITAGSILLELVVAFLMARLFVAIAPSRFPTYPNPLHPADDDHPSRYRDCSGTRSSIPFGS
jgi:hypothetical protein